MCFIIIESLCYLLWKVVPPRCLSNSKCRSRGFGTSRDLAKRRLIWYWNGVLGYIYSSIQAHPSSHTQTRAMLEKIDTLTKRVHGSFAIARLFSMLNMHIYSCNRYNGIWIVFIFSASLLTFLGVDILVKFLSKIILNIMNFFFQWQQNTEYTTKISWVKPVHLLQNRIPF